MRLGRRAGCRAGVGQRGGGAQGGDEPVLVERVDEHARLRRHELGRAADPRRDDRPPAGQRLEHRLAERLDEARLADDVAGGEQPGDLAVRDGAEQADARPALERAPQRAVADEGERALAEPREGVGEPDDVLALGQRADAEEGRGRSPAGRGCGAKRSRSTPQSTTSVLPRASGTFASSSPRSQSETAITAAARRATRRVAARTPGIAPTLATS